MSILNEVEDYLQNNNCFLNGLTDKPCHMDSYMTVVDYKNIDKALLNPPFTKEEMIKAANEMYYYSYLSPMANLASLIIHRKYCPVFKKA
jgi:hypothetical protein